MPKVTGPRTWRLERQNRKPGVYFVLVSGSRDTKRTIGLGYVTEEEAVLVCQRITEDEALTHGTPREGRLQRAYESGGLEEFFKFTKDTTVADVQALVGTPPPDYGKATLESYVADVYGPWRKEDRPKTWRTEEYDWSYILAPGGLGKATLDKIDAHRVDAYLSSFKGKRGEAASPNMQRKCRAAIKACLSFAYRKKHRSTPVPDFFRLRGTSQSRPGRDKSLTAEEVVSLIEHSVGWVPGEDGEKPRSASWANAKAKWQALWSVLFGLGLRPSEAAHLRWEDVDVARKEIRIGADEDARKTEASDAVLPLLPLPYRYLSAWWTMRGKPTTGLVFPAPSVGKEVPYKTTASTGFRKSLLASAKAAGINKAVSPYWGRHTTGTLGFVAGASADDVAKLLRHTDTGMVKRHYDHSHASQRPGIQKFGAMFGEGE